jgi:DNA transformation protein and related proteins
MAENHNTEHRAPLELAPMASDQKFVAYVCEQMRGAGSITSRKMFGEYAIYCDGTVVAFVCNNQLFVKPTPEGRAVLGDPIERPPWSIAKPHFLIDDGLDDPDLLAQLIGVTARAVPRAKRAPRARPRGAGS